MQTAGVSSKNNAFLIIALFLELTPAVCADEFSWLEQASSSRTKVWVAQQTDKTNQYLTRLPRRNLWQDRLSRLSRRTEQSVPRTGGKRTFFTKRLTDQDRQTLYWKQGSREHVLLPPDTLASGISLGIWIPSPDGEYLAYSLHPHQRDAGELRVRHVSTGRESVRDNLPWESYGDLVWSPDSRGFYYLSVSTALPATDRVAAASIRYHTLNQKPSQDPELYPPTRNASDYLAPHLSPDGRWLLVETAHGFSGTTFAARDLLSATTGFLPVFDSLTSTAEVEMLEGRFYLLTHENAPNGMVRVSSRTAQGTWNWETVIPERSDTVLDTVHMSRDALVVQTLRGAVSGLEVRSPDGLLIHTVLLPITGQISHLVTSGRSPQFSFHLESFVMPPTVCHASTETGVASCGGAFDINPSARFITETVHFPSADGTDIPMVLVRPGGYVAPESARVWMQVYGGFGVSMTPRYNDAVLAWLEDGGIYAVPHLRGGGEYGENWHAAGSGKRKQNTFDDAIGAAQFLIRKGYARASGIGIQGASNGGLTACAVITQRPDVFGAMVVKNPIMDMARYARFGEGSAWISEYGSPEDPEQRKTLMLYSPYHRIRSGTRYPPMLILAGESDDRVDPLHSRKFSAAMMAASTAPETVFFKSLAETAHGGSDSRQRDIEEWTDRLTFLDAVLGQR